MIFLSRAIAHPFKKLPLRTTLVVPFVLQIAAAVGLVSYLSFRSGQKAVNDLTFQLRNELTARIEQELRSYAAIPHNINQINTAAFLQDDFNFTNPQKVSQLLQQVKLSPFIFGSYCGNQNGDYLGVGREPSKNNQIFLWLTNSDTNYRFYYYDLDATGNRLGFVQDYGKYDPRERPWYKAALKQRQPTWSEIYLDFTTLLPTLTASQPVYDQAGNLLGVCATDVLLPEDFRKFLSNLTIGKSGKAFVMDRAGQMIASSTREPLTVGKGESAKLLQATASSNPLISSTATFLKERFGNFGAIQRSEQLDFDLSGQSQLVQVLPFKDGKGLDWLIVVTVPESDFMEQINANTRTTIALCLLALAVAIAVGIVTARLITRPVLRVTQASANIARGNLNQSISSSRIVEIEKLANSFNSMAQQLQESFTTLEVRNEELRQNEERFRSLVFNVPGAIYRCRYDDDWTMEFISDAIADISGYPASDFCHNQVRNFSSIIEASDWEIVDITIKHAMIIQEPFVLEYRIKHQDGSIRWVSERGRATFDAAGNPMYLDGAIFDITNLKAAEAALRLANAELEQRVEARTAELRLEKEKSERLLLNILPKPIADQLRQSEESLAESFEEVTILFADIVGFTELSARLSPQELVDLLNQIFSAFDRLAEKYGLEKIKTIGDAYMVAGGLPLPRKDHAEAVAEMALEMRDYMTRSRNKWGETCQIRIGINTGSVVAGVIGIKKFIYDLWGDAVNLASRMESHGTPGGIQVTTSTYKYLKDRYLFEERGTIVVKGRGEMTTYWLLGQKA